VQIFFPNSFLQNIFNEISLERDLLLWQSSDDSLSEKRIHFLSEFKETKFDPQLGRERNQLAKNLILANAFYEKGFIFILFLFDHLIDSIFLSFFSSKQFIWKERFWKVFGFIEFIINPGSRRPRFGKKKINLTFFSSIIIILLSISSQPFTLWEGKHSG